MPSRVNQTTPPPLMTMSECSTVSSSSDCDLEVDDSLLDTLIDVDQEEN